MSDEPPAFETAVIVFEGFINPAIFTLMWMTKMDIVDEEEAKSADVRFMDPELSRFDVSHYRVEARRDRVTVASAKALETFWPVKDFVEGIFEALPHTPIGAISMSKAVHTKVAGEDFAALSEALIGTSAWSGALDAPRLEVLAVRADRDDDRPGWVEVTVEPSQQVAGGAYIVATERLEFADPIENLRGARDALDALADRWGPWLDRADEIIATLRSLGGPQS